MKETFSSLNGQAISMLTYLIQRTFQGNHLTVLAVPSILHYVYNGFALLTKNQKNIFTRASVAERTKFWSQLQMDFNTYKKRMQ